VVVLGEERMLADRLRLRSISDDVLGMLMLVTDIDAMNVVRG
jgi:hypothetical protein